MKQPKPSKTISEIYKNNLNEIVTTEERLETIIQENDIQLEDYFLDDNGLVYVNQYGNDEYEIEILKGYVANVETFYLS
tara:strand:- start:916 stop:1152 length:237 start_codon:yes stop_codon:yes gene_type:complete